MILVTVGTYNHGFDRLVQPMDELAALLDEKVIIQRGGSKYEPHHAEHFQWTTGQGMAELTHQARLVVTHAGAGSIILALQYSKPLVVVPRLSCFNEMTDDHQLQLAKAMENEGRAIVVHEPSVIQLKNALEEAQKKEQRISNHRQQLVSALQQQLKQWEY